jgi:HEAT repeat protein
MAEGVFRGILAGGADALRELVALVKDPTGPAPLDYRAEYVLHGIAIHVGRPEERRNRWALARTLVEELGKEGHSKWMRAFLIRELQVAGGRRSAAAIGKHLLDEDLVDAAAMALAAIGGDAAAEELRRALPSSKGRVRAAIVHALGALKDKEAAALLRGSLADPERDVRTGAAWALASVGDPEASDLLLKAAEAADPWERILGAKACLLLAETLLAQGRKDDAVRLYTRLRDAKRGTDEAYLAEAAERGLAAAAS